MKDNMKNIIFFAVVTAVFLVVSYFFSILFIDMQWLRKDFLLSIASGIFASSCVVLFAEIVKYRLNKKSFEDALYANFRELYRQLVSQAKYVEMLFDNSQKSVPENVFLANKPMINNLLYTIRFIQYDRFLKNDFSKALLHFQRDEIVLLERYVNAGSTFPRISILETRIEKLKQGISNYLPTSNDEKVSTVLKVMYGECEKWIDKTNSLICLLDESVKHRFSWETDKSVMDSFVFDANDDMDIQTFFSEV